MKKIESSELFAKIVDFVAVFLITSVVNIQPSFSFNCSTNREDSVSLLYLSSMLEGSVTCFDELLSERYEFKSKLISSDEDYFVFSKNDEKQAISNLLNQVSIRIENLVITHKKEGYIPVKAKIKIDEKFDKALRYPEIAIRLETELLFRIEKNSDNQYKVVEIVEIPQSSLQNEASASLGFLKYLHSDSYQEEIQIHRERENKRGEVVTTETSYVDIQTQKVMFKSTRRQYYVDQIIEIDQIKFIDNFGKIVSNIDDIE